MRILLTNDDGVEAPGLKILQSIAAELSDDVWVIAPETDQSGTSHSVTLHEPLRMRQLSEKIFAVRGTPTDCVIMGIKHVLKETPPDLVLSGVNRGQNMADDVVYSGTIAGAMEGMLLGFPSVALSLAVGLHHDNYDIKWETPLAKGPDLIQKLLQNKWPKDVFLNINFPDCFPKEVQETSITMQGKRNQDLLKIEDRLDMRGRPYFWYGVERMRSTPEPGTDLWAVYNNKISVTPLYLDLTHPQTCKDLSDIF
ncbi:MAG: 5'/3'-nucleotidase SurE [Pseudomonadota bacterium]